MEMQRTLALLRQKYENRDFTNYAVYVGIGDNEWTTFAPDTDENTYFDMASCGKILHTTPLVMQAISEGKFTLDTTLAELLPDVPHDKQNIPIRQLLTHSSGIVRYEFPRETVQQGDAAILRYILDSPLAYAPGSKYIYSCNGMNLLALILERIYARSTEQLFIERIKNPLGLTRAAFRVAKDEPNRAICYRCGNDDSIFDDENVRMMDRICGAGGDFFPLRDVLKVVNAVMDKDPRYYPSHFYDLAETDYTPNYAEGRGLGWLMVDDRYPQTGKLFPAGSFGHCGHTGQSIFMNRDLNLRVVLLTNATRGNSAKHNFATYDYGEVMRMRADIHNAICDDLIAEGLLPA